MGSGQPVLVISKDWKTRILLPAQLQEEGYRTLVVEDLQDALQTLQIQEVRPALIILDSFQQNASRVALNQLHIQGGSAPILICSGASDPPVLQPSPGAFCHFLRRPISIEAIVEKSKQLMI